MTIYCGANFLSLPMRVEGYNPYIPELASSTAREIVHTVEQLAAAHVAPQLQALEAGAANGFGPMVKLFREVIGRDAGLLTAELPEEHGGIDLPLRDVAHLLDAFGERTTASTNVTVFGHTGIGTLPLLLYGDAEQKARFLPKFASGEWMAAFALTEPGAGSDTSALATKAVLSDDGSHYVLNGSKCFISNGGIADVITVFAKVDGLTTAFLVTKDMPGFSAIEEELKLGLHGSSTAQLFFENVNIPVVNRIGKVGQGDEILRRTLYRGRYNLAALGMGEARRVFNEALAYALERVQRSKIINFGAVQDLLATAALGVFGIESMAYRIAGDFDDLLAAGPSRSPDQMSEVWGALSVEASIAKVYGSEQLGEVIRNALKVFGGYGFLESYGMGRPLRDQVVSEIYDGTNQLHRVYTIASHLLRLAKKGSIGISEGAARGSVTGVGSLSKAISHATLLKEMALHALGEHLLKPEALALTDMVRGDLSLGQMALITFSDLVIQAYAADSAVRRAMRIEEEFAGRHQGMHVLLAETLAAEAFRKGMGSLEDLLLVLHPDAQQLSILDFFRTQAPLVGTKVRRATIAKRFATLGSYRLV